MSVKYPTSPYLGLAQYGSQESILFAGRDAQIDACAHIIAQVETRILLLHGQTGCGKSSFLRAGLIPALENRGFGYLFLRECDPLSDRHGQPIFVRSGPNPLASIARELYGYLLHPVPVRTALGDREYDLSKIRLELGSADDFVSKSEDARWLLKALTSITELIPSTLVIVVDQMEEVLSLNAADSPRRWKFFEFLKLFNVSGANAKLILSIRKDHSGEFIGLAQLDNSIQADFKSICCLT